MKKTNKKGFTLVELLAVIVILGVLLMIAVPAIQNVIKKSKRNSFESAIKLTLENVETLSSTATVSGNISSCYVVFGGEQAMTTAKETTDITLERGSYGNDTFGIIVVNGEGKGTAYVNGDNGTYYIEGKNLNDLSTSTPTLQNKPKYESLNKLIENFASDKNRCSAQTWWEK